METREADHAMHEQDDDGYRCLRCNVQLCNWCHRTATLSSGDWAANGWVDYACQRHATEENRSTLAPWNEMRQP